MVKPSSMLTAIIEVIYKDSLFNLLLHKHFDVSHEICYRAEMFSLMNLFVLYLYWTRLVILVDATSKLVLTHCLYGTDVTFKT